MAKRLVNDYEMLGELGRGAAGRVELCVKDGKARAKSTKKRVLGDDVDGRGASSPESMMQRKKPYLSRPRAKKVH